jgi:hypothetical protein
MKNRSKQASFNPASLANLSVCLLFLSASSFLWVMPTESAFAKDRSMIVLTDAELDQIQGSGFYFRVDMSLEVLTPGDTAPQVVVNTGTPLLIPTDASGGFSSPGASVSLTGDAQSNLNSLVNVIGAASVINVGVNVISITNSTNDTIYTTNIKTGAQGTGFTVNVPILP